MKTFNTAKGTTDWLQAVLRNTAKDSTPIIAEQIYKDSNEFTYRDTGEMYKSGELNSDFKNGVIVERTPYVRRRYYEDGKAGAGNPKAQARWFDKTVDKYGDDYKQLVVNQANKAKKE